MRDTIQQIKDLAKLTDNSYILHKMELLEVQIDAEILKEKIKMKESEVVKIIENYTGYVDRSRTDQCLHEVNFNFVAKDIINKVNSMTLKKYQD